MVPPEHDKMRASYKASKAVAGDIRGGPTPVRIRKNIVYIALMMVVFFMLVFLLLPNARNSGEIDFRQTVGSGQSFTSESYNRTYPITPPVSIPNGKKYRIALISDLDLDSKVPEDKNKWVANYLKGYLTINTFQDKVSVELDDHPTRLYSQLSQGGRGMELSELICFNGRLYTVDDRTGVVYEVFDDHVVPWIILPDGDGTSSKGFKGEWMAKKGEHMYVGGLGKEWTTVTGQLVNYYPQWVKVASYQGAIHHIPWMDNYNKMREKMGFGYPGYMIHESAVWSDVHRRWFFLPRRASSERYDEKADERRATNILLSCSEDFSDIKASRVGALNQVRGFSSFKFVPGTNDQVIVALKTEEDHGQIATYVMAFNLKGEILLEDQKFSDIKYEGIEFI